MLLSALHMGIITFDIETANIIDLGPGQDLDSFGPFDIAVAATHAVGGEERLWMSKSASGVPLPMMAPAKEGSRTSGSTNIAQPTQSGPSSGP